MPLAGVDEQPAVSPTARVTYDKNGPRQQDGRRTGRAACPGPIVIPKIMTIAALAEARELMRHPPEGRRERRTWHHVASELDAAAAGSNAADVSIALRMVLSTTRSHWPETMPS
jgi:hypothetical protein